VLASRGRIERLARHLLWARSLDEREIDRIDDVPGARDEGASGRRCAHVSDGVRALARYGVDGIRRLAAREAAALLRASRSTKKDPSPPRRGGARVFPG